MSSPRRADCTAFWFRARRQGWRRSGHSCPVVLTLSLVNACPPPWRDGPQKKTGQCEAAPGPRSLVDSNTAMPTPYSVLRTHEAVLALRSVSLGSCASQAARALIVAAMTWPQSASVTGLGLGGDPTRWPQLAADVGRSHEASDMCTLFPVTELCTLWLLCHPCAWQQRRPAGRGDALSAAHVVHHPPCSPSVPVSGGQAQETAPPSDWTRPSFCDSAATSIHLAASK